MVSTHTITDTNTRTPAVGWAARVVALITVLLGFLQWWGESEARRDPTLSGGEPGSWLDQWAVTTHLLPAVFLLVGLVMGWMWPLVGAVFFAVFAIVAAVVVAPEWVYLVVCLPPGLAAVLFLLQWRASRRLQR